MSEVDPHQLEVIKEVDYFLRNRLRELRLKNLLHHRDAALPRPPATPEARDWYESPAYQEAAQHRHRGAVYRGLIVEGV